MRPLLVGMNNPLSTRPKYALWPDPPGCSGYNLWKLLHDRTGITQDEYVERFDRMNLVTGPWDKKAARAAADRLVVSGELVGRPAVVLLGQDVRAAFGIEKCLIHPQMYMGAVYRQLPHPSGLNTWYNDPANRLLAGVLMEELSRCK